uniref:Tify domain-containing protein n=1 Tax=Picea sitchensis TaxID=3332 RepID=A9NWZ5_PICSI|nr:unknown [Picea sitchensis]
MASAFEEHCNQEKGLPSWIKTVNGGAKRAAADFIPRLDLSSVGSCFNSIHLFPNQSGFGSPIAVLPDSEHRTSSDDHQDGCSGFVTSFRPAASTIPSKQSCAQLTIFYGGVVNVYDDIPADQAQAIMLIASSENYSGYPHTKVQNSTCRSQTELKTSLPVMKFSGESDLPIGRKHSLQRFLKNRKERVIANAKSPYTAADAANTPKGLRSNSPPESHPPP